MFRNESMPRRSTVILLVEDDPGDQELTRRVLEEYGNRSDLRVASNGEEAMNYLLRQGQYVDSRTSPRPDLILLDLNMPRVNGRQVLERLQQHRDLDRIPVVVLTTSNEEGDIVCSYDLGCNSFIQKPVDIAQFTMVVRELEHYWFDLVALPAPADACLTPKRITTTQSSRGET